MAQAAGQDSPPLAPPSISREFLGRHLVLALAVGAGFGCGALAVFLDSLNAEGIPFLEWSVGLYVVPPVLLGWSAVRSWVATVAGSAAYLSAVLGHLTATHLTVDDYNVQEYWAWFLVGFVMGTLLGFLGNRFRSHATGVRAFAAGVPLGVIAVFLWVSVRAYVSSSGEEVHLGVLLFEGVLALLLLALCRGWSARGAALVWALVLSIPFIFGMLSVFTLVWFASGDY
ncbi:hypothetical protein HNR06_000018 [Nocardiopsis arvandica]|uniref:Uncharacterized protein n=1 Tax=Nocardiopsis sinuspersici TaxID=501010 RepID=A0A7Y9X7E3_9ACTN|nr:DUF6518 family protein [Nocardiopsis sinuspersici]NYH50429.1 hypothetical protein [Nocardiopsis sinuspersici]